MKKVWTYFAIKSLLGMYLCVVVVTCTGIIVSKISSKPNEDTPEEKEE